MKTRNTLIQGIHDLFRDKLSLEDNILEVNKESWTFFKYILNKIGETPTLEDYEIFSTYLVHPKIYQGAEDESYTIIYRSNGSFLYWFITDIIDTEFIIEKHIDTTMDYTREWTYEIIK